MVDRYSIDITMSTDCGLLSLPPELLIKIMQQLPDFLSVVNLGRTCRLLSAVAAHDSIWQALVMQNFQPVAAIVVGGPAGDIREGWQDFVQLFGSRLVTWEATWENQMYFETWREAFRSLVIRRRKIVREYRFTVWWARMIQSKTWQEIFADEIYYQELCAKEFPDAKKLSSETWRRLCAEAQDDWNETSVDEEDVDDEDDNVDDEKEEDEEEVDEDGEEDEVDKKVEDEGDEELRQWTMMKTVRKARIRMA